MTLLVVLAGMFITALSVLIHYEFMHRATLWVPILHIKHRFRIVVMVFVAIVAHVVEVALFALAYVYVGQNETCCGRITGNFDGSFADSMYFSFTSFTTLGMGDIAPLGKVRFLVGMEALVGLVLITWTASFLFYEMQRHWEVK